MLEQYSHPHPVWADKGSSIIGARIPEGADEQLWARQVSDTSFEICCIPLFVYGMSLGDVVATDSAFNVTKVLTRSGRRVFRVWFSQSVEQNFEVEAALRQCGALTEWYSTRMLGVDAADVAISAEVSQLLNAYEATNVLVCERGDDLDDET